MHAPSASLSSLASLAGVALLCLIGGHVRAGGAPLRPEPAILDFGDRGHGEDVPLDLELTNTTDGPLRILSIRKSCGCTRFSPSGFAAPLAPGESVTLEVVMRSGRIQGLLDKYIEIRTDRSDRPLRVPTRMRVFPGVRVEPYQFRLAGEVGGRPVTTEVSVTRRRGAPVDLRIEGVVAGGSVRRPLDEHFEVRSEKVAGGRRIHLTVKPTHPEGRIFAELTARLDGKSFRIPVAGEMYRGLKLSSRYLNFNRTLVDDPETLVEEVELSSIDGREFRIVESEPSFSARPPGTDLGLDVRPFPSPDGRRCRVQARLRVRAESGDPPPSGSFSGRVRLVTSHPEKRVVELLVMGFFPRQRGAAKR